MSMRNTYFIKGEISTLIIVGALVLSGAAILITTILNKEPQTTGSYAQSEACPYDSGIPIPLGQTESNPNNAENRVPISTNRHFYDIFGDSYFSLQPVEDEGILTLKKPDGAILDAQNTQNIMASIFGYKPKRVGAYYLKYNQAPQGNDAEIMGVRPILEVPTDVNHPDIKVPNTGYDIGGGYEAMVVFTSSNRISLHIGRHEYFTGTKTCANGQTCSGGYWIYIKGICVDQQIQNAYNKVKGAQESAGADLNPIQLPMVRSGQILGKANGAKISIGVSDNGSFVSTSNPKFWGGVPEVELGGDQGTNPTNTTAPTNPPVTPSPTPQCQQTNFVHCPNTGVCVPTLVECEGVPTNTPTPIPTKTPTPTTTPTTAALPITTNTQAPEAITCQISGLYVEVEGNTITKFETRIQRSSEYGPKVAHASQSGIKQEHIAGESINSTFWGPGSEDIAKFSSIDLGNGKTHHFYVEIVKKDGSICAEQAFSCSNNNGTVTCSVISATTTTFQTTEDRDTQGEIENTSYGTGIVIGG